MIEISRVARNGNDSEEVNIMFRLKLLDMTCQNDFTRFPFVYAVSVLLVYVFLCPPTCPLDILIFTGRRAFAKAWRAKCLAVPSSWSCVSKVSIVCPLREQNMQGSSMHMHVTRI